MLFLPSGYLEEENLAYSEIRIIQLGQEEQGRRPPSERTKHKHIFYRIGKHALEMFLLYQPEVRK